MRRSLRDLLDGDEVPPEVPHWIVELHIEFDERELTPLQAVRKALRLVERGHCWEVIHIRSGLRWSVDLGGKEVVEMKVVET